MRKDFRLLRRLRDQDDLDRRAASAARRKRILKFFARNAVVAIAVVGAIVTCFFVPPDKEYLKYPNYNTLLCLLCMMLIVRGLKDCKFFGIVSGKILDKVSDRRAVSLILIFLPALFAYVTGNDIASLTFIPFTVVMLQVAGSSELIVPVVLLQTMVVKLSGVVSPLGSTQNLFLIDYYDFDFFWFIKNLWPLALCGYALTLILCLIMVKPGRINTAPVGEHRLPKLLTLTYFVMIVFVVLSIFNVLPYYIVTPIIIVLMALIHPRSYKKVKYGILVMFLAFFVMSGNFMRMEPVKNVLTSVISGHEFLAAIIVAQPLTTSPVALVFPAFSTNTEALMYGISVGKYGLAPLNNFLVYGLVKKYDEGKNLVWKLIGINMLYLAVLAGTGAMYLYL